MKILKQITKPILLPHWSQDLLLAIPRILCGYLLTVEFGSPKFGLPWSNPDNGLGFFEVAFWFPQDVAQYGGIFAILPGFFAWMGAFSEAVGGIFLLLGLQTRIASFLIFCTMLVAIFMQQMQNGLWNCLPAMGFLWVGVFYMIVGSGRFGIDYLLTKKVKQMKTILMISATSLLLLTTSCVQKTQKRTVIFTLDVSKIDGIKTVGIRGWDSPLSWDKDYPMEEIVKDSLYRVTVTGETGRICSEFKFSINDKLELDGKENRKIYFDTKSDTTKVTFVYNKL